MTIGAYAAVRRVIQALAAKGIFSEAELRQLARDLGDDADAWDAEVKGLSMGTRVDVEFDHVSALQHLAGEVIHDMEKARG